MAIQLAIGDFYSVDMLYKIITFFLILIYPFSCLHAQKHDYNWVSGYEHPGIELDNTLMDFNFSPPQISTLDFSTWFSTSSGACSDSLGNLLFYDNGARIYNTQNEIMEGGDMINPGQVWNITSGYGYAGLPSLSLPKPSTPNMYFLFHFGMENGVGETYLNKLYYSIIDMNANNGLGKVTEKNIPLLEGRLMVPSAVKHGNGRDWWIMGLKEAETQHYLFLLSPEGITGPFVQDIGPPFDSLEYAGRSLFSNNGNMYLRHDSRTALRIYDFDRCSGLLSNVRIVPFQEDLHSWDAFFSPNDRFLYFNRPGWVWSIDLWSDDISASYDSVATWELNYCPYYSFSTSYLFAQLAPDGKIYYSNLASTTCLNVMHRPNLPGDAADCEEAGVQLPNWNDYTLNRFPNYRLGDWESSPCDTLNLHDPEDGFQPTYYNNENRAQTTGAEKNYTILPPIPGAACEGCTPKDLEYLNNPLALPYAIIELRRTGKLPIGWPKDKAEREGLFL